MMLVEGVDIFRAKAQLHCTLILSRLVNVQGDHDLGSLAMRYLGRTDEEKTAVDDWLKMNKRWFIKENGREPNFQDVPIEIVKARCMYDSETTLLLYHRLKPIVDRTCPELYQTERDIMLVTVDMESRGHLIDLDMTNKLRAECSRFSRILKTKMQQIVGPIKAIYKKKGQEYEFEIPANEINPKSPKHMVGIFNKLGIELKYKTEPKKKGKTGQKTGGGNWSFNEASMMKYIDPRLSEIARDSSEEGWRPGKFYAGLLATTAEQELTRGAMVPLMVLKINELEKLVNTYYDYILENVVDIHLDPRGMNVGTLHCRLNPMGADSGRYSSSEPNLQNIPRILGPRECFIPRFGYFHLHPDYDQVEMKIFVHLSEDEGMRAAVEKDIHMYAATKVYQLPEEQITKEKRKRAKSIGFGILYGARPKRIGITMSEKGLPTTATEAMVLFGAYHREFPSIRRVTQEFELKLAADGFCANAFGRRYHMSKKVAYKMLNYMCQGTSADIMKIALVVVWKWLRANNLRSRLILTIHDEIVIECPIVEASYVASNLKELMEFRDEFFVPITVSVDVVKRRWSIKQSVEEAGLVPADTN